jgi:hypothetical protein
LIAHFRKLHTNSNMSWIETITGSARIIIENYKIL